MGKLKIHKFKPKRNYKKIPDFKSYYVTGAIGGFRNPYDFRLAFYQDDINDVIIKKNKMLEEENLTEEEITEKISKMDILFFLKCEIIMTELAAKELYNFLGKELQVREQIKKEEKKFKEKSK